VTEFPEFPIAALKTSAAVLKRAEARPLLQELLNVARKEKLTLVYSARDQEHNQAVVLKELLDSQL
jgi:uncharacterized protein YeaO (DUF488 family)